MPDPLLPSKTFQDKSVPSKTNQDQHNLPGQAISQRTHQDPIGPSIIYKAIYLEKFIRNVDLNFKLYSCFPTEHLNVLICYSVRLGS